MPRRSLLQPGIVGVAVGTAAGALTTVVIVAVLIPQRESLSSTTPALALVLPGVVAALLGGRVAAATVALATSVAFGVAFLPPYGTWKILQAEDVTAAVVFGIVAVGIGELTAREGDRRRVAEARSAELEEMTSALEQAQVTQAGMKSELSRLAVMAEIDEQRSALLRSVSHDLRTPLATIRGVATDLRGETNDDDATRTELLGLVSDEAERLDRLVANLLSMSRVEAGAFAPDRQAVDLAELLATSAHGWRGRWRDDVSNWRWPLTCRWSTSTTPRSIRW